MKRSKKIIIPSIKKRNIIAIELTKPNYSPKVVDSEKNYKRDKKINIDEFTN